MLIRAATEHDATAIAQLLGELGYPNTPDFVVAKIGECSLSPSIRLRVAEIAGGVAGFLHFDSQPLFHQSGRIGCIMALCVKGVLRGNGVGHELIRDAEAIAIEQGCIRIAVASGLKRTEAHKFYTSLGYEEITKRFVKQLEPR